MDQSTKDFSERLNKYLDEIEVPTNPRDRSNILSKMVHIPKQQAWGLIEGQLFPGSDLLKKIATELEIDERDLVKK